MATLNLDKFRNVTFGVVVSWKIRRPGISWLLVGVLVSCGVGCGTEQHHGETFVEVAGPEGDTELAIATTLLGLISSRRVKAGLKEAPERVNEIAAAHQSLDKILADNLGASTVVRGDCATRCNDADYICDVAANVCIRGELSVFCNSGKASCKETFDLCTSCNATEE